MYNFFANKIIYIRKKYLIYIYTLRYRLDRSKVEFYNFKQKFYVNFGRKYLWNC